MLPLLAFTRYFRPKVLEILTERLEAVLRTAQDRLGHGSRPAPQLLLKDHSDDRAPGCSNRDGEQPPHEEGAGFLW